MDNNENNNTQSNEPKFWQGLVIGALGVVIIVCVAVLIFLHNIGTISSNSANYAQLKADYIKSMIKKEYIEEVDDYTLNEGVYAGMLASLGDRYAMYYDTYSAADEMIKSTQQYGGIGATLAKLNDSGKVQVQSMYVDCPAEKAGVMVGDYLLYADDKYYADYDLDEFVSFIRGEIGTDVVLTIEREGEAEPIKITVTRDEVVLKSVDWQMVTDDIGYIEISSWGNNTTEEYLEAISDLESQGMKKIIVDLRLNGGGVLDEVAECLDEILPAGITVYSEDRHGKRVEFKSDDAHHMDYPMVVLTSAYTASASEIFTAAIRDFGAGISIGTNTFGKGVVQTEYSLADGTAFKFTTAYYYTPSGKCIDGEGIAPDIELELEIPEDVEYSLEVDNQVLRAIEELDKR